MSNFWFLTNTKLLAIWIPLLGALKMFINEDMETENKQFNKTWNIVDHLRMHEGIRPYRCHLWEKLFTQKGNLQKHLRQHVTSDVNQRKKYSWDEWGKSYTERYNCLVIFLNFKVFLIIPIAILIQITRLVLFN